MTATKLDVQTITLPTEQLVAVAKWASSDADRVALNHVVFRRQEMVASDAHRAVRVPLEASVKTPFGIHRNVIMAAQAAQRALRLGLWLTIATDGSSAVIYFDANGSGSNGVSLVVNSKFSVADYPPIDAVDKIFKPAGREGDLEGHHLRPEYLEALAEIHRSTPGLPPLGQDHGMRVVGWHRYKMGGVVFENDAGVRCVIMPIKPTGTN